MINKFLLGFFLITVFSFPSNEDVNEEIRIKLENVRASKLTAYGDLLQCPSAVDQFYQNRFFAAAWDFENASQLMTALQKADDEGLVPQDYHIEKLQELSHKLPNTALAKAEYDLLLTDAFLLYISHLLSGKVNPLTTDAEWHVIRREGLPIKSLEEALSSGNVNKIIQEALPQHRVYQDLQNALKTYRSLMADAWLNITEGMTIKKGMEDERIPLIRDRLFIFGDLKDKGNKDANLYDDPLFTAIQDFQKRNGLESDGEIGRKTIAALNVPIEDYIGQIKANMERWRWLPQEFGEYYIKVNIANFEMEVIKNNELIRSYKIIVGKPYRRTPVFSAKMEYIVLNPTWTIPPVILNADVIPGVKKEVTYLEKKNIIVLDKQGNKLDPKTIDWSSKEVKGYTYRQPPGPENALGAVKFMFPNNFHVYLHDTPAKDLFEKKERAFSSGCIRVHQPLTLAEYLLNDSINWTMEKIAKVVATTQTQTIRLKEQPYVHILYWTAWTDADGIVQFRKDIYERDQALIKALLEQPPS